MGLLAAAGASVLRVGEDRGRVEIAAVLAALHERDVRSVLVEGGGEVHGAFLDAGLVDRVAIFVAPRLLGGRQATALAGGAGRALKDAVRLVDVTVRALGEDWLIEGDVAGTGQE